MAVCKLHHSKITPCASIARQITLCVEDMQPEVTVAYRDLLYVIAQNAVNDSMLYLCTSKTHEIFLIFHTLLRSHTAFDELDDDNIPLVCNVALRMKKCRGSFTKTIAQTMPVNWETFRMLTTLNGRQARRKVDIFLSSVLSRLAAATDSDVQTELQVQQIDIEELLQLAADNKYVLLAALLQPEDACGT